MILGLLFLAVIFYAIMCAVVIFRLATNWRISKQCGVPPLTLLAMAITLLLYMVPIVGALARARLPVFMFTPMPIAALFFVPHLILSRFPLKRFERSGTSRIDIVERPLRDSVWMGYIGIVYTIFMWCLFAFVDHRSF